MDPRRPLSLVGMSMSARKRAARAAAGEHDRAPGWEFRSGRHRYRIGERLRPCPGCPDCAEEEYSRAAYDEGCDDYCDGSGVLPARKNEKGATP